MIPESKITPGVYRGKSRDDRKVLSIEAGWITFENTVTRDRHDIPLAEFSAWASKRIAPRRKAA